MLWVEHAQALLKRVIRFTQRERVTAENTGSLLRLSPAHIEAAVPRCAVEAEQHQRVLADADESSEEGLVIKMWAE